LPGALTIGRSIVAGEDQQGGTWLLDLESAGVVQIVGDQSARADIDLLTSRDAFELSSRFSVRCVSSRIVVATLKVITARATVSQSTVISAAPRCLFDRANMNPRRGDASRVRHDANGPWQEYLAPFGQPLVSVGRDSQQIFETA
jgi:hypothetical protein